MGFNVEIPLQFKERAQDEITGFGGIITGFAFYQTGCVQVFIAPTVGADGVWREGQWFDLGRVCTSKKTTQKGGPINNLPPAG